MIYSASGRRDALLSKDTPPSPQSCGPATRQAIFTCFVRQDFCFPALRKASIDDGVDQVPEGYANVMGLQGAGDAL